MMAVTELLISDAADQKFTTVLSGQRCTFRFRYNPTNDRWSFDLRIGDRDVLFGRRVVPGADLLDPFQFGLGSVIAVLVDADEPNRESLPERRMRIYHVSEGVAA